MKKKSILEKLGYRGQSPSLVINPPEDYRDIVREMKGDVHDRLCGTYPFIQFFAQNRSDLEKRAGELAGAAERGGHLWICYPKGTSKKYRSDLNRSLVLEPFGPFGLEGVTQVAIDENWSALRVRPVEEIKSMKRKWAFSEEGKKRIG